VSDEWTSAWEVATGAGSGGKGLASVRGAAGEGAVEGGGGEDRERGVGSPGGAQAVAAVAPEVGQLFTDGLNPPGFVWQVFSIVDGLVRLVLFRDGEPTESFYEWPLDRWR
jgi:hypothetical protein